jgi:hypothetical protein
MFGSSVAAAHAGSSVFQARYRATAQVQGSRLKIIASLAGLAKRST